MAGTLGTLLLMAGSVLAAACALFWPQIEQAYLAHHTATAAARGSTAAVGGVKGKCPLVSPLLAADSILICSSGQGLRK